jgi:hypothetical protein
VTSLIRRAVPCALLLAGLCAGLEAQAIRLHPSSRDQTFTDIVRLRGDAATPGMATLALNPKTGREFADRCDAWVRRFQSVLARRVDRQFDALVFEARSVPIPPASYVLAWRGDESAGEFMPDPEARFQVELRKPQYVCARAPQPAPPDAWELARPRVLASVVRIDACAGGACSSGLGFFVNRDGHVVTTARALRVVLDDNGRPQPASRIEATAGAQRVEMVPIARPFPPRDPRDDRLILLVPSPPDIGFDPAFLDPVYFEGSAPATVALPERLWTVEYEDGRMQVRQVAPGVAAVSIQPGSYSSAAARLLVDCQECKSWRGMAAPFSGAPIVDELGVVWAVVTGTGTSGTERSGTVRLASDVVVSLIK